MKKDNELLNLKPTETIVLTRREAQQILDLIENPPPEDLLIRRLKKRKLLLKDRIIQLEEMLVPDIPA